MASKQPKRRPPTSWLTPQQLCAKHLYCLSVDAAGVHRDDVAEPAGANIYVHVSDNHDHGKE